MKNLNEMMMNWRVLSDVQCTAHHNAFQAMYALYGLDGQIKAE